MNVKRLISHASVTLAAVMFVGVPVAYAQADLPENIRVPDGHKMAMTTVGVGEITYECKEKANAPGQMEWFFVGPKAQLNDTNGKQVGTYFGPPAT